MTFQFEHIYNESLGIFRIQFDEIVFFLYVQSYCVNKIMLILVDLPLFHLLWSYLFSNDHKTDKKITNKSIKRTVFSITWNDI